MNAKYIKMILLLSQSVFAMQPQEQPLALRTPQVLAPAEATHSVLDIHRTSSAHRVHDAQVFTGSVTDTEGKEVRIDIRADKLHESDQKLDAVVTSKRTLIISHGAVALVVGVIGTGVTLAIKYGDCHK